MKAEIIAVGTELLLGQIVNTNAHICHKGWLSWASMCISRPLLVTMPAGFDQAIELARNEPI